MRIRQVRQEFWTDELLATVPDSVRLFYIGLWCVADDAGWFRTDASRIGALLYPYRGKARREREVRDFLSRLADMGRVRLMDCGCGVIPTLRKHQVVGGKRSEGEYRRHLSEHEVPIVPEKPEVRAVIGTVDGRERNGTVRNGNHARKRENETGDGVLKARVGWEGAA